MARIRNYIVPESEHINTYRAILAIVKSAGKINAIDICDKYGRNIFCVYGTEKQHAEIDNFVFNLYNNKGVN